MKISDETKKYIRLVEMQEDVKHGIDAAFVNAKQTPMLRGGRNRFWLISNPTGDSEFVDTISFVDTESFGNIALGASAGNQHHSEYNYELWSEFEETAAKHDAYTRWMNKLQ